MNDKAKGFLSSIKTKLEEKMTFDKIVMDSENSMLRLGFGRNDGHKSFRIDLWSVGYRINSKSKRESVKTEASSGNKTPASKVYGSFKIDKISVDSDNTVIRIGYGKHKGTKFFRVDLWSTAYRITKNVPKTQ
jgi:hypothetical protein